MEASSKLPSNHSFGTAFDINSDTNPQGKKPPAVGQPGSVRELVPIFEKHGFKWGGQFPDTGWNAFRSYQNSCKRCSHGATIG